MLATVMNALAMEGALEQIDQPARVLSAVAMPSLCQPYSRQAALAHLVKHRVIILAGGTGNPFFTTDTGASLRAAELSCDAVMKATQVDGIYSADPKKDPNATRFDRLSHDEAIARNLQVMDTAAFALAAITVSRSSSSQSMSRAPFPPRSWGRARDLRHAMSGNIPQAHGFRPNTSAAGHFIESAISRLRSSIANA